MSGNPIGIMQGRLLPPIGNKIQAFPVDGWGAEFIRAKQAGLSCMEWIYEVPNEDRNPFCTADGLREIRERMACTGIGIWSMCADYYMEQKLIRPEGVADSTVVNHLVWLIGQAEQMRLRYIVLPFVDASSLKTDREIKALESVMRDVIARTFSACVELHLETDLPPERLVELLESINQKRVRANFDMGNSASLGWNPAKEMALLCGWLGSVHVKDRVQGGGTVPLGTGSVDFKAVFAGIRATRFTGPLILQAAREPGITETDLAIRNRRFVEKHLANMEG